MITEILERGVLKLCSSAGRFIDTCSQGLQLLYLFQQGVLAFDRGIGTASSMRIEAGQHHLAISWHQEFFGDGIEPCAPIVSGRLFPFIQTRLLPRLNRKPQKLLCDRSSGSGHRDHLAKRVFECADGNRAPLDNVLELDFLREGIVRRREGDLSACPCLKVEIDAIALQEGF